MDDEQLRLYLTNVTLNGSDDQHGSLDDPFCPNCATVYVFVSRTCPHCTAIADVLDQLQQRLNTRKRQHVYVYYSDSDPDAHASFGVRMVPTILIRNVHSGVWYKYEGSRTLDAIVFAIEQHSMSSVPTATASQVWENSMMIEKPKTRLFASKSRLVNA